MPKFHFRGRTLGVSDRMKMASPGALPPGAGIIALVRQTSGSLLPLSFCNSGGQGAWALGRSTATSLPGLYRPVQMPTLVVSATADGAAATTASFTPPPYCTLVAFCAARDTVAAARPDPTDSLGNTWTRVILSDDNVNDGTAFLRDCTWQLAIGASPAARTITVTSTGATNTGMVVLALPSAGLDWTNVVALTGAAGTVTETLPSSASTNSIIISFLHQRDFNAVPILPSGYTDLGQNTVGTTGHIRTAYEDNPATSSLTWGTASGTAGLVIATSIEVKCEPFVEHSSATWNLNQPQVVLGYSASASEHYLAIDSAGSLQKFTTTTPFDTLTSLIAGRMDTAPNRGRLTGELHWLGVLKGLPPTDLLDRVLRQLAPPTILKPWLAHLVPLIGRDIAVCMLTGKPLVIDAGTPTLASTPMLQPQERERRSQAGVPRRTLVLTQRNATGNTVVRADIGPLTEASAFIVTPASVGGTVVGVAANGAALATTTLPSAAPAQQGSLVVGAPILDGVAQTEAGTANIGAIVTATTWTTGIHESLWGMAEDFLRPAADPISVTANTGSLATLDLQPLIKDPSGSGCILGLSAISVNLTASLSGYILSYQATIEGDYTATLTITSKHPLAPSVNILIEFAMTDSVSRYANGYLYRAQIRLPVWSTGSYSTFLLPIVESDPLLRSKGNGGAVEHPQAFDIRVETTGGTKLPHRVIAWGASSGRAALLVNFARNFGAVEDLYLYIGKPGLTLTEEDLVGARAGGWLAWNLGVDAIDYSGMGRPWTTTTGVATGSIGDLPAGVFNGTSSLRSRTSSELDGLSAMSWVALVQTPEAAGRAQEFFSLGTGIDPWIGARFTGTAVFHFVLNVSGVLQSVTSDIGYYAQNRGIGLGGGWASGGRLFSWADGGNVDPPTPNPGVTGTITANDVLRIGAGGRDAKATFWNGPIGCLLLCSQLLPAAAMQCMTAALSSPQSVYGRSSFRLVSDVGQPPIALRVSTSVSAGTTSAPIEVKASAYNPSNFPLTVTLPAQPSVGSSAVDSSGRVLLTLPSTTANTLVYAPFQIASGSMVSKSVIRVSAGAVITDPGPGPDPGTDSLPADFGLTVPTFTGTIIPVNSAAGMRAAVATGGTGDIRIRAAGGVDYGPITISQLGRRFEIICTRPRFTSLNTAKNSNLALTGNTDKTARNVVVVGDADPNISNLNESSITSGIDITPQQFSVLWVEGFDFKAGQRVFNQSSSVTGDVWLRKCKFHTTASYHVAMGSFSASFRRLIEWECWHYSDGARTATGAQAQANYTDYGNRMYNGLGVYLYKNFYEGGMSHIISMKMAVREFYVYNCMFMPWTSIGYTSMVILQLGQEGSVAGKADRTCGLTTVRNSTFGSWDNMRLTQGTRPVVMQDATGLIFENNLVYPQHSFCVRLSPVTVSAGETISSNDLNPVRAGSDNVRIAGNTILGVAGMNTIRASDLYAGAWDGMNVHIENNTTTATHRVTDIGNQINLTFGSNPGYSR